MTPPEGSHFSCDAYANATSPGIHGSFDCFRPASPQRKTALVSSNLRVTQPQPLSFRLYRTNEESARNDNSLGVFKLHNCRISESLPFSAIIFPYSWTLIS